MSNVEFAESLESLVAAPTATDKEALLSVLPRLIAEICDPEIEWIESASRADGRSHHGHAGVLDSWVSWLEGFDEYSLKMERVVRCGDDVLVVGQERARGITSGAPVAGYAYALLTLRAGKLLRCREFSDEREVLRAAGLEE